MSLGTSDIVTAIFQLLPGFVSAWVFFGLTGYEPKNPFERIIHALILTAIVTGIVIVLRSFLLWVGNLYAIGGWNSDTQIAFSFFIALLLGFALALAAHNDIPHKWFRGNDWDPKDNKAPKFWKMIAHMNITRNRAEPSEWFGAFAERPARWITLHLEGGRRLYGYPREWPNSPKRGHFNITDAAWLLDDGEIAPTYGTKALLIDVNSVEMVEVLYYPHENQVDADEIDRVAQLLVSLKEKNNAKKTAAGTTTEATATSKAAAAAK